MRSLEIVPSLVSSESIRVEILEESGSDDLVDDGVDIISRWPDVGEHDRVTLGVIANGLCLEVNVDVASKGVGDDKRRRGQVVGPRVGANTTFEVTVAGENSSSDEIVLVDRVDHLLREGATIADASHAAVASGRKAKLIKVGVDA